MSSKPAVQDKAERAAKAAFLQLRPICSAAANIPSVTNFTNLLTALEDVQIESAPQLVQYILFPMMVVIQKHSTHTTQVNEAAVKCLLVVVKKVKVTDTSVFLSVFDQVSTMIFPSDNATFSDELIHSALQVMLTMFEDITESTLCLLCTVERLPFAGHMIAIALTHAHKCPAKEVKLTALNFLQVMFKKMSSVDGRERKSDSEQYWTHISGNDLLASLLPGIVTMLCRIITEPNKYSEVQARAVNCLETFLSLTLDQKHCQISMTDNLHHSLRPDEQTCLFTVEDFRKDPAVILAKRDALWWCKTVDNLQPLIHRLVSTLSSQRGCVRVAVARLLRTCIRDCLKPLKPCMDAIIGMLLCVLEDDDDEVSDIAREGLTLMSKEDSVTLLTIVTDALQDITLKLPTFVLASVEDKMLVLKQVRNFLCLLGDKIHVILNSECHWLYLEQTLLAFLETDPRGMKITDLSVVYPNYGTVSVSDTNCTDAFKADVESLNTSFAFNDIKFLHIENREMLSLILDTVNVLGYFGNIDSLVTSYLDRFRSSRGSLSQVMIILSHLLWGAKGHITSRAKTLSPSGRTNSDPIVLDTAEDVLYYVIDNPLFSDSVDEEIPVKKIKEEKLLHCLMLYCIRGCFKVLGSYAQKDLLRSLYPLLDKLGSPTPLISEAAFDTIQVLCREFNCSSVGSFLQKYSDYVINTACLNLRYLDMHPNTTRILEVLIQHSNIESLAELHHCIKIIISCLSFHQDDEFTVPLIQILEAMVSRIQDWHPQLIQARDEMYSIKEIDILKGKISTMFSTLSLPEEFNRTFIQFFNQQNVDPFSGGGEEEGETEEGDEEEEKRLPLHVEATVTVMEAAIHNLHNPRPVAKIKLLKAISSGMSILRENEDELLPLVHKTWWFLEKHLLNDKEFTVRLEALNTLQTISEVSGSFIRQRVTKQILPTLLQSLQPHKIIRVPSIPSTTFSLNELRFTNDQKSKRNQKEPKKKEKCEILLDKKSVEFKVQKHVLLTLSILTTHLKFHDRELYSIINASYQYLHKDMPDDIQLHALYLYRALVGVNPDLMWVFFHSLGGIQPSPETIFKASSYQAASYRNACRECLYRL